MIIGTTFQTKYINQVANFIKNNYRFLKYTLMLPNEFDYLSIYLDTSFYPNKEEPQKIMLDISNFIRTLEAKEN